MPATLDLGAYPHILDNIIALAPYPTLLRLRTCTRDICHRVDVEILKYLQIYTPNNPYAVLPNYASVRHGECHRIPALRWRASTSLARSVRSIDIFVLPGLYNPAVELGHGFPDLAAARYYIDPRGGTPPTPYQVGFVLPEPLDLPEDVNFDLPLCSVVMNRGTAARPGRTGVIHLRPPAPWVLPNHLVPEDEPNSEVDYAAFTACMRLGQFYERLCDSMLWFLRKRFSCTVVGAEFLPAWGRTLDLNEFRRYCADYFERYGGRNAAELMDTHLTLVSQAKYIESAGEERFTFETSFVKI